MASHIRLVDVFHILQSRMAAVPASHSSDTPGGASPHPERPRGAVEAHDLGFELRYKLAAIARSRSEEQPRCAAHTHENGWNANHIGPAPPPLAATPRCLVSNTLLVAALPTQSLLTLDDAEYSQQVAAVRKAPVALAALRAARSSGSLRRHLCAPRCCRCAPSRGLRPSAGRTTIKTHST